MSPISLRENRRKETEFGRKKRGKKRKKKNRQQNHTAVAAPLLPLSVKQRRGGLGA